MRALALPVVLIAGLLVLASLGSLVMVALAYGLASLLGRWLALTRLELTALCFVGLLAAIWFTMRAVNAGLVASITAPIPGDDDDYGQLGPYDGDDEVTVRRVAPPRANRRKGSQRP